MAPTKPLVAQQIDACHKTCGIPGSHAAELHGDIVRARRAKAVRVQVDQFTINTDLSIVRREARVLHDPADTDE